MDRRKHGRYALGVAAAMGGLALMAAPAMAGTRADISMKTVERFVAQSSSDHAQSYALDCGSGYQAFSGSWAQPTTDNGGDKYRDVQVSSKGVPIGSPGQWAFSVEVKGGAASDGEDPNTDNDQAEDPQPTSGARRGTVKLFVTCIATRTSAGDTYTVTWPHDGAPGFKLPDFPKPNWAISGQRHRRIVVNNDEKTRPSRDVTVGAGRTAGVTVPCPRNTFGNVALRGYPSSGGALVESEPRGNKWEFTFHNSASISKTYTAAIDCVQPKTAKQRSNS